MLALAFKRDSEESGHGHRIAWRIWHRLETIEKRNRTREYLHELLIPGKTVVPSGPYRPMNHSSN